MPLFKMSELVSQTIYNKSVPCFLSRYRYFQTPVLNLNSNNVTLASGTSQTLQFRLNAKVPYNLSRSYIAYTYTVPASASLNVQTFANETPFRTLTLGPPSGPNVVDMQQGADCWVDTFGISRAPQSEFLSRDPLLNGFGPCNTASSVEETVGVAGLTTTIENATPVSIDCNTANSFYDCIQSTGYTDIKNINSWGVGPVTIYKYFPLGLVKDTLLSMNRDIIHNDEWYLTLGLQWSNRMAYYTVNPTVTITGGTVTGWGAITPCTNITMFNIFLYLAVEKNNIIVDSLYESLQQNRLRMHIPFPVINKQLIPSSVGTINLTYNLTNYSGSKLKKATWKFYSGQENNEKSYWCANTNGSICTYYQTSLNSQTLQDNKLYCFNPYMKISPAAGAALLSGAVLFPPGGISAVTFQTYGDDFRENYDRFSGSPIMNYFQYQLRWSHTDYWGMDNFLQEGNSSFPVISNAIDGLDCGGGQQTLLFSGVCPSIGNASSVYNANGLISYLFLTYVRMMVITTAGVFLEA